MKRAILFVAFSVVGVLVLGGAFQWWMWRYRVPVNPYVRPPLKQSQLWAQASFALPCRNGGRCVPPLECVYDYRVKRDRCLTSECWTDQQCDPGYACRDVAFVGPHPLIFKMCVVEGAKREGEFCAPLTHNPEKSCARGLQCQSFRCGRACDPADASTCPVGFKCVTELNVSTCLPNCLETGCPPGERCYLINNTYSVCGVSSTRDCEQDGCPRGQTCEHWPAEDKDKVLSWCRIPCGADQSCPEGSMCIGNLGCLRKCSKATKDSCGPDYYCMYGPPNDEGQCYPGN